MDDVHPVVVRNGRVDVGGNDADEVADPRQTVAVKSGNGQMLVTHEPHLHAGNGRVAMIHALGLQTRVDHRPTAADGDDLSVDEERLEERLTERGVLAVHHHVASGLNFVHPVVQVVGSGAA